MEEIIGKTDRTKNTRFGRPVKIGSVFVAVGSKWVHLDYLPSDEQKNIFIPSAYNDCCVCTGISIFLSTERRNPKENRFAVSTECICQAANFLVRPISHYTFFFPSAPPASFTSPSDCFVWESVKGSAVSGTEKCSPQDP